MRWLTGHLWLLWTSLMGHTCKLTKCSWMSRQPSGGKARRISKTKCSVCWRRYLSILERAMTCTYSGMGKHTGKCYRNLSTCRQCCSSFATTSPQSSKSNTTASKSWSKATSATQVTYTTTVTAKSTQLLQWRHWTLLLCLQSSSAN